MHKQMLNTHQTHQDMSTLAKSCVFNITYPSPDLFLVIRIEKVLQQGDIGECAEPYVKAQQQSASQIEKLQASASQFCERLGKYRMPFVWTAINIMSILNSNNGSGELATSDGLTSSMATAAAAASGVAQKSSSLDRRTNPQAPVVSVPASAKNANSYALKNAYESFRKSSSTSSAAVTASSVGGVQPRDGSATRRSNSIKDTNKVSVRFYFSFLYC